MSMPYRYVTLETKADVVTLALNAGDGRNALTHDVLTELEHAALQCAKGNARAVILSSAVARTFSVGADIPQLARMDPAEAGRFAALGHRVVHAIEQIPTPTIAAVNGPALGGGWELALACDLIYASEQAVFGFPEVTLGLMPTFGGLWHLMRVVGPIRAKELVLLSKTISAEAAKEMGLVLEVLPPSELQAFCVSAASRLTSKSPAAILQAKRLAFSYADAQPDWARVSEQDAFRNLFRSKGDFGGQLGAAVKKAGQG